MPLTFYSQEPHLLYSVLDLPQHMSSMSLLESLWPPSACRMKHGL